MRYTTTDGPSKDLNAIQDGSLGDIMGIAGLGSAVPDIPLRPVFRGYEGIGFRKLFGAIA